MLSYRMKERARYGTMVFHQAAGAKNEVAPEVFSELGASSEFKDYNWSQLLQVLKGILAL